MSRRDIIIAAVLVNTGLLAILFMLALHTDKTLDLVPKEMNESTFVSSKPHSQEILIETNLSPSPRDELDQMLKDFPLSSTKEEMQKESSAAILSQPIVSPPTRNTPSKPKEQEYVEVTVKRGDYLEKIAKANGTTIEAIMKANKLSNERLDIGQILKIPLQKKIVDNVTAKKNVNKQTEISQSDVQFYTLKSGDNPWKVAKEFRVKFDDLLKLNNLDEEKAKGLKPGDVLRVH